MARHKSNHSAGFTLLELLIVVAITPPSPSQSSPHPHLGQRGPSDWGYALGHDGERRVRGLELRLFRSGLDVHDQRRKRRDLHSQSPITPRRFGISTQARSARAFRTNKITHGVTITPDSRFAVVTVEGVGGDPGLVEVYDLRDLERRAVIEVGKQASGIDFWKLEEP